MKLTALLAAELDREVERSRRVLQEAPPASTTGSRTTSQ